MQQASDILDGKLDAGTIPGAVQKRKAAAPKQDFDALYARAHAAGMVAGNGCVPVPMVVIERDNPLSDASPIVKAYEPVMDGVCGFAWVSFKGNTPWAKWAKAKGVASEHYPSGYSIWVGEFNQSMTRKESYAHAFAKILRDSGIMAYADSRLD